MRCFNLKRRYKQDTGLTDAINKILQPKKALQASCCKLKMNHEQDATIRANQVVLPPLPRNAQILKGGVKLLKFGNLNEYQPIFRSSGKDDYFKAAKSLCRNLPFQSKRGSDIPHKLRSIRVQSKRRNKKVK